MKRQIADSFSENLTDSDLESKARPSPGMSFNVIPEIANPGPVLQIGNIFAWIKNIFFMSHSILHDSFFFI